jgi:two-component system, cell cycle sensor histidine kinase and response regulator CckA
MTDKLEQPDMSELAGETRRQIQESLQRAVGSWGIGHWSWLVGSDWVEQDADLRRLFEWSVDSPPMPFSHLISLIHPSDRQHFLEAIDQAKNTGTYPDELFRVTLPSGRLRWILAKGQAMRDTKGEITQIFGTSIDVTQSKQADTTRERNQKLEALGQLAAGVAHDFNNLLVAILGNIELARQTQDPNEHAELLDEAGHAALRARDLTSQLLAFGRRQPLKQRKVDIATLVRDTVRMLQRLIPEVIEIKLDITESAITVLGDAGQLEQALVNLCVNARDAMPNGGSLTIQCFSDDNTLQPTNLDAVIIVSDTGSGIPDELQSKVFDPFFTTKATGTGLGLSTAYGVVTQHGGTLSISSDRHTGTSITIRLPAELAAGSGVPTSRKPTGLTSGNGETILVAEDERPVRNIVARILRRAGYVVLEARDGQEAVDTFKANQRSVSLLLLDAVMPRKSGSDALAEVRLLAPSIPVVMSSGYSDVLANNRELAPQTAFLGKPYEPDDLLRTVREQLDAALRQS